MSELTELIKSRKSVRTFDERPISAEDAADLKQYAQSVPNPFDIPVRFVFLDAAQYGLSSPVLSGEKLYVAGIVNRVPYADVAFGYSFEKFVLHAWSKGIGTTWIGGTMKRELFEKAAGVSEGEMMPCISPLGYPAKKRSVKEVLMRKGVGADSRLPLDKLFFSGSFDTPASKEEIAALALPLELVQWAPSAVNKQPWRIVSEGGKYHFYEKKDKGYVSEKTGDMQKIDIGIALCHFAEGLKDQGLCTVVSVCDPGIEVPSGVEYIATVALQQK